MTSRKTCHFLIEKKMTFQESFAIVSAIGNISWRITLSFLVKT